MQLLIASIEHDLEIINDWFKANKLTLNKKKSVSIFFNSKTKEKLQIPDGLKLENSYINFVDHTKFLGIWIDKNLTWTTHTNRVIQKIKRNAHMLFRSKNLLSVHAKKILYYAQIYSHISYGLSIWGPMINKKTIKKIQSVQKNCLNCFKTTATKNPLLLSDIIKQEVLKFGWKITLQELPIALQKCAITTAKGQSLEKRHRYETRNKRVPNIPIVKNSLYKHSVFCVGISSYGDLPNELKNIDSYKLFCKQLKQHLSTVA